MPRLGLRKLREQAATYRPGAKNASGRKHLSLLVTVNDHAINWGFPPPPFAFPDDAGRRDTVMNRPALRRIWRAISGDNSAARRKAKRKARRAHGKPAVPFRRRWRV